jgi:hypothetical protein
LRRTRWRSGSRTPPTPANPLDLPEPWTQENQLERAMKINGKDIFKFLSGAFFVTAGASWYFWWVHFAVPFPFFGFETMTPEFLGIRGFIHFTLFLISFYFGFVKKS